MKFLMAIFGLGVLCALWVVFQQMLGGERRGGCGGGGSCAPKPNCDGQGGCGGDEEHGG